MLEIYETGMMRPVPLFPSSSYKYSFSVTTKDEDKAFSEAMKEFNGSRNKTDTSDLYISKVFGDSYEPGDEFIKTAVKVYSPMIEHEVTGNDEEI
jgi:exonuclease V gamma subunit